MKRTLSCLISVLVLCMSVGAVSAGFFSGGGSGGLTGIAMPHAQGDVPYADSTTTWAALAKNANSTRYICNSGASNNPAWCTVSLFNGISAPTSTQPALIGNTTPVNTSTSATFATADKTQIDKTGAFTNAAVGDLIIVTGGTGATTGLYRLTTRTSADSVKVDRNIHASGTNIVDGAFTVYKDVVVVTPTDGTNGQMITGYSHQNKPLQIGGTSRTTTVNATSPDLMLGDDGKLYWYEGNAWLGGTTTTALNAHTYLNLSVGNIQKLLLGVSTFQVGDVNVTFKTDNAYDIGASGATRPKDIYMAGYLYGNRNPIVAKSTSTTLTAQEIQNTIIETTAAVTHTLPAVSAALVGTRFTVNVIGAYTVSIDPNASDRIRLSGTALTDGNKITSDGLSGSFVELYCDSTDGWTVLNMGGTWIDGGA